MFSQPFTTTDKILFRNSSPFSHLVKDNFLEKNFATILQSEILNIPDCKWDRYNNPFEDKFTLRDKWNMPDLLCSLFREMESGNFVEQLEMIIGTKLYLDPSRNFWGVHKFKNGDKLDIHLDAGIHPFTHQKKQLTLGIYLSSLDWKPENKGNIELWKSDNFENLVRCSKSIEPVFNRLVIFDNSDNSWHGSPDRIECRDDQTRIFVTISYMSYDIDSYKNRRTKAYFKQRPHEEWDAEKLKLRDIRCDPLKFSNVYNTKI